VVGHILPVQSKLNPGDILVVDNSYTSDYTGGMGALFRVDPTTGERTILSDFSVGANQGCWPFGVAVERSGKILVIDPCADVLFRVDPTTGSRTVLSDFNVGANQGVDPTDVAVEASGNILVVDGTAKLLFRIDPITGERTVLSDFGVGDNQGVLLQGVAVERSGKILVVDPFVDVLFRVDPITGKRTVLSDFGVGDNQGVDPFGVAVEASGNILVIDINAGTGGQGTLFRINPITGKRTVLSDFGFGDNQGVTPVNVAVEASGNILVTDKNTGAGGQGVLFRVDPITGKRTVLSDFGVGDNQGVEPWGVAVYILPPPVGGVVTYVNKLEILTPYLALAGLIVVISSVYIIRKRKD